MPNWIGDFVMGLPILEDLRGMYPEAKIAVVCKSSFTDLLDANPYIDEIIAVSFKRRFFPEGLISKLRKERYDLGILLTNSFSSAWHFFAGRVKKRVGFYKKSRAFFLTQNIPFPEAKEKQHLVITYKALIGSESSTAPKLFTPPRKKKIGKTLFGINPGAAYGSAKCWLPERFREVISDLLDEVPNSEVHLFGDGLTKPLVDTISLGFDQRVVNHAGKTTLKELIQEIGRLDAFLTNDSGPMHIAASLNVPLVALFGSTNPYATGPYKTGKVICKAVSCSPCYRRVCPIDFRCMKQIEVDEVVKEMKFSLIAKALEQKPVARDFRGAREPEIFFETPSITQNVGTIIMAAGMGRRLGFAGPKGCFKVNGKTLYETLIEKIPGKVAIMTSPATHIDTKKFLESKGLHHVDVFQERCLPRLSMTYEESPEGNGAIFAAFYGSPLWNKWSDVEEIRVLPIDNPLAEPISACGADLAILAVEKINPQESIGVLLESEKKLYVCEYSELPKEGNLESKLGYSGIFSCSKSFFEKAAHTELPWHTVTRNGTKHFERFVFDAFSLAKTYKILLKPRKTAFAPIKTKEDVIQFTREVMK